MPRRALLLKFRENSGFVSGLPFRRHRAENFVADGFALPIGDNRLLIEAARVVIDGKRNFRAVVEDVQIVQRVDADFGIG